ncbi:WhiB family transcriptional regulator [Naumannella cuiyingiana]|uniref:Transcriptional regulator WhiB n=1 Tax=Naumannella cuiyingiana TaxID=1347891 RepID=A0A7Z0IJS9_9ACTN|nr:WhiB family transcriptional regulator [Naumannella cuiyingiana]NYI69771.1 WhiB family redox-sensing transcriptional regulator [Naumannella cuiyingiana]
MTVLLDEVSLQGLPCHLVDPEVFFADAPGDIEYAKGLCTDCPLRTECLAGALRRGEAAGVWGGELLVNGEVVARKRPRGRPRKHPRPVEPVTRRDVAPNPLRGSTLQRPAAIRRRRAA